MTIDQIILIIALFGSAKVAIDMVVGLFRRNSTSQAEKRTLDRLLRMTELLDGKAEELVKRNQALEAEITQLKAGNINQALSKPPQGNHLNVAKKQDTPAREQRRSSAHPDRG